MGPLSGYKILDCTDAKGTLCVKTLAGMGAAVKRVGPETLREAVKTADILVETGAPGYPGEKGLGYKDLEKINPGLIMASITPFGQGGPYQDFKASDLTLQAMGGWLSVTGEADAPLKLYGSQAYYTAGLFAANGILLALRHRRETGRGQHIDISIMECAAATLDQVPVRYFYQGIVSGRRGSRHWNNAFDIFRCRDGYILLSLQLNWETLAEWLDAEGMAEDLAEARWGDRAERDRHIEHIVEVLGKWTLTHGVKELAEKGQLMHFPWAEVVSENHAGAEAV
ncbi:MAG: CoA transferase [Dehalococcoidales bacterium]|jgi:crotonobetainyl-CoA:carnitine CoA-transferase CaiB-like acyl-CoA transferase